MKYDFTSIMDRRGKDAIAVDALGAPGFAPGAPKEGFDAIPMWVADMNFPTVPTIPEAIIARARHPAYGYFSPTEEYFASIIRWHETRNGVTGLTKECIGYENGVLGGVVSALNIFCSRGDNVLLHSPTYIGFTHSLENNGYNIVHSPLVKDENNVWRMDFEDMEKKIDRFRRAGGGGKAAQQAPPGSGPAGERFHRGNGLPNAGGGGLHSGPREKRLHGMPH